MKIRSNIFFYCLVSSFLIPFIFQKSIFPFYRFGMFAEPPKQAAIQEEFKVLVAEKGIFKDFDAQSVGLYPSVFNQLLRNYYYRNEAKEFLRIINTDPNQNLYFVRIYDKNLSQSLGISNINVDTIAYFKPTSLEF